MLELAPGWTMQLERGPDWLIVRLHSPPKDLPRDTDLAEPLWLLLRQHFTCRLVLELDEVVELDDHMIEQILELRKRIEQQQGVLRLCGLSEANRQALCDRLAKYLPDYRDRTEAVLGGHPCKPR